MNQAMNNTKHIYFALVGCTMLWATFSGCQSPESKGAVASDSPEKIQSVEIVNPQFQSFTAEIIITGTAIPNRQVMLHAMESGYVSEVLVDIGDVVAKGQVLANLSNPEISREKQQLEAEVEAKKANYERLQESYEKTPAITPLQMLEEAKAEYLGTKAMLDATDDQLGFLNVKSPFGGVITQRFVDEGAIVQSAIVDQNARVLFEIHEVNPIRLEIPLPESDAYAIEKGMEVHVVFPELPGKSFDANVSRTSNSLDEASKTMILEVDIENKDGNIRAGMYGKASIELKSSEEVLSLPITAQYIFQNEAFVLVVEDGVVQRIPMRKGISNKDYFEVLNEELNEKSQVIVQGKSLVRPGQKVKGVFKK
jgi:RND family efflux transporter MFP subunit